jgi:hypothetical protein
MTTILQQTQNPLSHRTRAKKAQLPCCEETVLREHEANATEIFDILASLPENFMAEERIDTPPQERELVRIDGLKIENWIA